MTDALAARLGYRFHDSALLQQALTHRSYGPRHNERLEFVGDAVLNCVIGIALYDRFPGLPEGDLSRARASLVNRDMLAELARDADIGALLLLGDGERKSGGSSRPSILADALEAVFGAVYVDGGFEAARAAILALYAKVWDATAATVLTKDPKTRLQEWLQARRMSVPDYVVSAVNGEAHAQAFAIACRIEALGITTHGSGASRRVAEQAAAAEALKQLDALPDRSTGRAT